MGGFAHTGVANATLANQYAVVSQVQNSAFTWVAGGGTADAITATYSPAVTALTDGMELDFRATAANATATPTFSPNGIAAHTITQSGGTALGAGSIPAALFEGKLRYNLANTRWELMNPAQLTAGSVTTTALAAGAVTEAKQTLADNTTGNVSTSAHGYVPKAPNDTTKFLRGDATWGAISGIAVPRVQTFTASGTYTPNANMLYCTIECWGGGGGGGGTIATAGACGTGGGAGGYARLTTSAATIGVSKAVTIGAGGVAGANTGALAGTGGTTSVGSTLLQATGGTGGIQGGSGALPGTGGIGSLGDVNAKGAPGGFTPGNVTGGEYGGFGGNTSLGGGGYGFSFTVDAVGISAQANSGSGGGGAAANGTAHVGGTGGSGLVVITEYCSA